MNVPRVRQVLPFAAFLLGPAVLGLTLLSVEAADNDAPRVAAREDGAQRRHALEPALRLAKAARDAAGKLDGYEATFSKKELVGRQMIPLTMQMKFRTKPMSVYLNFAQPHEGREVLFVEGRNGGKLLAHETGIKGLIGTVALVPTSPEAMSEGRYPITQIGMEKLADGVVTLWESELKHEEPEVKYYNNAKLGAVECQVIESTHPVAKRPFFFHRTRLYIDKTNGLPVRVEQYGFPQKAGGQAPLIEEYTYSNVRTNPGLTDADFDPRNKRYGF